MSRPGWYSWTARTRCCGGATARPATATPLALDRPLTDGIQHERQLLDPLRDRADLVVDTSKFTLGDLKRVLDGNFALKHRKALLSS